jgi:hypothetical protein
MASVAQFKLLMPHPGLENENPTSSISSKRRSAIQKPTVTSASKPEVAKRKHHTKRKTGGITCKSVHSNFESRTSATIAHPSCQTNPSYRTRHIKYDEGRPFCKRCVTGGWTCDGYTNLPQSTKCSNFEQRPPLCPPALQRVRCELD